MYTPTFSYEKSHSFCQISHVLHICIYVLGQITAFLNCVMCFLKALKAYVALLLMYIGPRSHISYLLMVFLRSSFLFDDSLFTILGVCIYAHTYSYTHMAVSGLFPLYCFGWRPPARADAGNIQQYVLHIVSEGCLRRAAGAYGSNKDKVETAIFFVQFFVCIFYTYVSIYENSNIVLYNIYIYIYVVVGHVTSILNCCFMCFLIGFEGLYGLTSYVYWAQISYFLIVDGMVEI